MLEILTQPTVALALLGVLCLVVGLMHIRHEKFNTRTLVMAALLLALAVVLQQLRLFHMPQGGSVTAGAMLPLLLIGYRFGVGTGLLAGFVYGMMNMVQDPFILHPVQVLFDYPLPFMAMGLAGLFRQHLYLGTLLAFGLRFLCHFISGFVFFGSYAPEGVSPIYYSLVFNATYLVPEMLICCLLLKVLPVRKLLANIDGQTEPKEKLRHIHQS
nr:energy-coupled thiamine transporter ThiT [Selenomonas ruminantium]